MWRKRCGRSGEEWRLGKSPNPRQSVEDKSMNTYNDDIAKEASRWIARLNSGAFSATDETSLRDWLDASEKNRLEYHAQVELWQDLAGFEGRLLDAHEPEQNHRDANLHNGEALQGKLVDLPIGKAWRRLSAAATGLVAASLFAGFLLFSGQGEPASGPQRYLTQKGHQTEALLADNTRILMNTNSNLVVEYQKEIRHVALEKGEAFFDVATDPERPFIVETAWGNVRVLGTKFNVLSTDQGLRVDVLEGLVEVISEADIAGEPIDVFLTANQSITVSNEAEENVSFATEVVAEVAPWRDGVLTFSNQPLADVIVEINRYTSREINIVSPSLEDQLVSGSFNIGDVSAFLEGLEAILPLKVERQSGKIIIRSIG